jgi:2,4-diketo-3-deoxy-L-fuconate hydrolase
MKLARVGEKGSERPVLVDEDGGLRLLTGHLADLTPTLLAPSELARITNLDPHSLPLVEGSPRYGVPVAGIRKIIAIGLNYVDHAGESGHAVPEEPVIFMKAITALGGPDDDVRMPRGATAMDWEVELGVVIGTEARYVAAERALDHVAGYVLVNDLSERDHQLRRGGTWDKGKSHDGFAPVGPWFVTRDELGDAKGLDMFLDVSGQRRQTGNTASMVFDVATLVAYVSEFMTLEPGDLIATGTPAGVGLGMSPPTYLAVGDEIRLGIAGLGEQRQQIVQSS